jgi:exodeoxyribonuclease VII small subunit
MSEPQTITPDLETLGNLSRSGTFEESMLGLEQAVARLEEGQLSIGDAVKWYELGLALSQRCSDLLKQAELDIQVLETKYDFDQLEDLDDLEPIE